MSSYAIVKGGVTVDFAIIDGWKKRSEYCDTIDVETIPMQETTRTVTDITDGMYLVDRKIDYDTRYYSDSRIIRGKEMRNVWYYTMEYADGTDLDFMITDIVGLREHDFMAIIDYGWHGIATRDILHLKSGRMAYADAPPAVPNQRPAGVFALCVTIAVVFYRDALDPITIGSGIGAGFAFHMMRCWRPVMHQMRRRLARPWAKRIAKRRYAEASRLADKEFPST